MNQDNAEIINRCKAELFDPQKQNWEEIKDSILEIEKAHFGAKAFTERIFKPAFENPETTAVLLKDTQNNKIVGFSYAEPVKRAYRHGYDSPRSIMPKTAYISDTAIDPEYTGHGLVGKIMEVMEKELIRLGYEYLERDAAIENGYAEKIMKVYKDRILIAKPHDSEYGPQIFFRIKLV